MQSLKPKQRTVQPGRTVIRVVILVNLNRDGEVPQMTTSPQSTSPRIWVDLAPGTGPYYALVVKIGPPVRYRSKISEDWCGLPVLSSPSLNLKKVRFDPA